MRLRRKNLVYSMLLAGVMLLFLAGYFMYMLPSLYVDYVMEQNLKSIREQHRAYVEKGSYEGIKVKNSTACISIEIPAEGNCILVTGKAFSAEITLRDKRLVQILDKCREKLAETDLANREDTERELEDELGRLQEILQETIFADTALPVSVRLLYLRDMEGEFQNESVKLHSYSDGVMVIESGVEEASGNRYANYIAVEQTDRSLILSFLPVVAPDVNEIRPVVLQSLPMLVAVIVLAVLLFSGMYSKGIVKPVVDLVRHAEQMKYAKDFSVKRLYENTSDTPENRDEVWELADTLDDFYAQIKESYQKLEEKNRELEEENERQEIFLRASSHQLKTPVAAALLLVDGMMNEVGKYKETKTYLPRVKEQLLSMRKIVEDILYLNRCSENIRLKEIDAGKLLRGKMRTYQVAVKEKGLSVSFLGDESLTVLTDEMMISQILDNLLSNAVRYTPSEGSIRITTGRRERKGEIRIENFGVTISTELLPHIFEPFVSGNHDADASGMHSHGLGLYIASYYGKKLNLSLSVQNGENSVISILEF